MENFINWQGVKGNYKGNEFNKQRIENKLFLYNYTGNFKETDVGNYIIKHYYKPVHSTVSVIGKLWNKRIELIIAGEGVWNRDELIEPAFGNDKNLHELEVLYCQIGIVVGIYAFLLSILRSITNNNKVIVTNR